MFVDKEDIFNCVPGLIFAYVISEIFFDKKVFELLHWRFYDPLSGIDILNSIVYIFRNNLFIRVPFRQHTPDATVCNILLCKLPNESFILRRKPSRIRVTLKVFNRSVVVPRVRHLYPPNTSL
ncbi:hypothetical protein HanRHA438_Chr12g0542261 [Helianthus annuus]|nr:hypothetical protein HanRHA438_Chr12g0542261 [Helianthus annuus]